MAYDYEKIKAQYEALSPDKQKQFAEMNKNDTSGNFQKFMNQYNSEKNQSTNTVKNSTQNTGSTVSNNNVSNTKYGEPTEYQGTGGSNKTSPYANQGAGNYSYSDQTQYYEKNGQNSSASNSIRDKWDSMDYDQQQEFLKNNPNAKSGIVKAGGTIKQSPYENQGEGQYVYNPNTKYYEKVGGQGQTQNQGGWDYQDNSPERMAQMARNVNDLAQSDPRIFNSEDSFRKFFIDGKGRTPEQEAFLMDLYKNMKIYNQYDGYTAEEVGDMFAHGKVPEDYLNYVKNSNPDRYAAIMDAKDKAQDQIKNESYYGSILEQNGFEDTNNLAWQKKEGLLVDENNDLIDDRRYHEPTEEERQKVDRINEIDARLLEINNAIKRAEEDLTKAYPGASKSTIMAMVQDRSSTLLREKDDLMVERTQLAGTVNYLQSERQEQDKAGADTISQLQKNLGMYYQYAPEGMSELAQAQYAATNVTLDQADNGTDTQKQMALDSVLTDYFDKYGSIIQRSKSQVINDVMKLAKDKGITLSQALQENFITPLKSKPQFETLSTGGTISNSSTDKWTTATIKDADGNDVSVMINQATGEIRDLTGKTVSQGTGGKATTGYGKEYNVLSSEQLVSGLGDFMSGFNEGDKGGQCGAFVNKGLKAMGVADSNIYDNSKESKLQSKNEEVDATAQTGWVAIRNPDKLSGDGNKYGHVGFVIKDNGDGTVQVLDSNGKINKKTGKGDETINVRTVKKSSLYGYFNPSKGTVDNGEDGDLFSAKVLSWIPTQLRNTDVEKQWYLDIAKKQKEKGLTAFETAMSIMGFDITNKSPEAQDTKKKILDVTMAQGDEIVFNSATLSSMAESINRGDYESALRTLENQVGKYTAKQLGNDLNRDNLTTAMQAVSDFDVMNNGWAEGAWNTLSSYLGGDGPKTIQFNSNISNISSALRNLGYTDNDIELMLPKLTYNKSEFKKSIDTIQKNILSKYNAIRKNHGLPEETRASLLGNVPLSSIYGLNAEVEAMDAV